MSTKRNPYSSRWDLPYDPGKVSRRDALLLSALDVVQSALYYEGILIELDPTLYLPALETWCHKYPDYGRILLSTAESINETLDHSGGMPAFIIGLCIGLFEELDVMVNGEMVNNLNYLARFR